MSFDDDDFSEVMKKVKAEYHALEDLHDWFKRQPAVVDDWFPEWQHVYESKISTFVSAVNNRYGSRYKNDTKRIPKIVNVLSFNAFAARVRELNDKWWRNPEDGEPIERNHGELLMLMVSELAEAMEGHRKNKMDDHLPHRKMVEVELADTIIRIADYAGGFGLDVEGAIEEKLQYNKTRADHTHEARMKAGGKKY